MPVNRKKEHSAYYYDTSDDGLFTPDPPSPKEQRPLKPIKKNSVAVKEVDIDTSQYTSRNTALMVEIAKWPRLNTIDPEGFEERVNHYFQFCIENSLKPTPASLCIALNISKDTYSAWLRGETMFNPRQQDTLQRAHLMLQALTEVDLVEGKGYPASLIFYLKNHFGFKDTSEKILTTQSPYNNTNADAIREQYMVEQEMIIDNDGTAEIIDAEFEKAPIQEK